MNGAPHPEVVNAQPKALIVGFGHVGKQVARYFDDAHYVDVDGEIRHVRAGSPQEPPAGHYDLGFICVPTPQTYDGSCDVSAVCDAWAQWAGMAAYWCVKSTVAIGTTDALGGGRACFSPEYYGETLGHPLAEPSRETFVILGGPPDVTEAFAVAWTLVTNSCTRIYQTDARTAELCKLMENSWIAAKVSFCNQFYDLARLAGVDWHTLRELWLADPRVSRSHTYVYPGNRGWGGKCIPKDTANLCAWARGLGDPAELMEMILAYNEALRGTK